MLANKEGQKVPAVTFRLRESNDWVSRSSDALFANKTVIVFSLPGAFTPTCSSSHVPRFNQLAPASPPWVRHWLHRPTGKFPVRF